MGVAKELVAPIVATPLAPVGVWLRNKVTSMTRAISSRLALDLGLVVQDRVQQ